MLNENLKVHYSPYKEHGIEFPTRLVFKNEVTKEFTHFIYLNEREEYELNVDELDSHLLYRYKYQKKTDNKWVDFIPYKPLIDERKDENGIKYIYFPNNSNNYLVVVFQGIKEVGRKSYYNYIKTLHSVEAPRLYIKDDYGSDQATQSSYYLGPNKDHYIAKNVLELIERKRKKLDIPKNKVICAGSSKGGFAALYFAFRGGYGYAVSGGPQIMLGDYLSKGKLDGHEKDSILPPILQYLCNEITYENINWANNILFNTIEESNHHPFIYLHVGQYEPHYKNHVKHFLDFCEQRDINGIKLDLAEYDTHKELAKYFPDFLIDSIHQIIDNGSKDSSVGKRFSIGRLLKNLIKK